MDGTRPTHQQMQAHVDRVHRAIEAQTVRLIVVERENRQLRQTIEAMRAEVAALAAENGTLRVRIGAASRALAAGGPEFPDVVKKGRPGQRTKGCVSGWPC